jgi:hypothetical protein
MQRLSRPDGNIDYRNYQQDLNNLIDYLDPVLKTAWEANADARHKSMWGCLLLGPFSEFQTLLNILKAKKYSFLPILATGPIAVILGFFGWNSDTFVQFFGPEFANGVLIVILSLLWYIGTVIFHFFEMAKLDSPHFHIGAFARLRKAEYEAFKPFIQGTQRFSFQGLKDWLYDPARIGGLYREFLEKEREWLNEKEQFINGIESINENYKKLLESKNKAIEDLESNLAFAFRLLHKSKVNIARFTNGQLTPSDLEFICPYTLYKLEGDMLIKIADVGTSGNGKNINIHEKKDYACVQVLSQVDEYYYDTLGPDRSIFSYKMRMPDNSIWVINFHINEKDDQIMEIFFGDGIIDTETLFDLVYVHCKLLFMYMRTQEKSA